MTTIEKYSVIIKDRLIKDLSVAEVMVELSRVDPSLTGVFKIIKEGAIRYASDYHDLDGIENVVGSNNDFYLVKDHDEESFEIIFGKEKLFKAIHDLLPNSDYVEYLNLSRDTDELENIVGELQLERFTTLVKITNKLEEVGFYSTDADETKNETQKQNVENKVQDLVIAETRDADEIEELISQSRTESDSLPAFMSVTSETENNLENNDDNNSGELVFIDPNSNEGDETEEFNLEDEDEQSKYEEVKLDLGTVSNVYQQ